MNGKNFRLRIPELHNQIDIALCKFNIKSNGVTITLQKNKKSDSDGFERWTDLKPKSGMISKDVDKTFEKNSNDPMASMQEMMKDMYQKGDDKTKSMIAESWQKAQDEKKPDSLTSKLDRLRKGTL